MVKKRISRARKRDLEQPDEFITFWTRLIQFASENKTLLSSAFGFIVAVVIVVTGFVYYLKKTEKKALVLLQQATYKYQTVTESKGPYEAYLDVDKDFQLILEKYDSRNGGKLARFVYANICYNANDYDKAIDLYNKSIVDFSDEPFLKNIVLNGLGYAYKDKKDFSTAAKFFEMIVSEPDAVMKDEALFNLGGLYAKMGLYDKSEDAFNKILSDHADSMYIEIAKERVKG